MGKPIKVLVSFHLFAAKKNQLVSKQLKKKIWGTVNSTQDIPIIFTVKVNLFGDFQSKFISACNKHLLGTGSVPVIVTIKVNLFEDFQSKIISTCNKHLPGAGSVIKKGRTTHPQVIYWYGGIA
ncbi:hypothetical protein VP01_1077g5 [Puccinia sorghi]|uniref:Uncharacterized protein n=1 Tax=Puccinia sorghi TaxID=27349 RepID=A0A0L6VTQ2_9BASI|nr:hypothetical protein VP01_1077g5 [Puccinia sorghi]